MDVAAGIALGIFLLGITFAGGKLAARVDGLEEWKREVKPTMDAIFETMRRIENQVKRGAD